MHMVAPSTALQIFFLAAVWGQAGNLTRDWGKSSNACETGCANAQETDRHSKAPQA